MTNPIPRLMVLARFAAAAVAGIGLFSLATWGLGQWRFVTFGTNYIPMAPVTALLFVLLGLAFGARLQWPGARASRFACALGAMLTVTVGGLVLAQAWWDLPLPWDTWLVRAPEAVGAIPIGRMSPLTAITFILSAAALCGQSLRLATRTIIRRSIYLLASAGLALGGLVTAGYAAGSPPLYGGTAVPMALLTALAFMSLNAGVLLVGQVDRLLQAWRAEVSARHIPAETGRFTRRLILSLVVISGLILLAGLYYLRREEADARVVIYRQLESIGRLKVDEISTWRNERLGEARFLQQNPLIRRELATFATAPGDTGRRQLQDWLEPIKGGDRYASILVFDPQGRTLLAIPSAAGDLRVSPGLFAQALAASKPVFGDIERDVGAASVHLDLLVPVSSPLPAGPATPIGVIMLRLDPAQYLFPRIQSWPVPSASAELVLVRRDGDEVVLLNDLRHQPGSALTLRRSIHETRLPIAMVARGETGVHEGVDYRGDAVLSVNLSIPDSPWFLVAKMDLAEAYAPIQRDAWQTGAAVVLLLVAVVLAGISLWRQRHTAFLRSTLLAEREHQALAARLGLVLQHANDCIFLMDETGHILEANDRASAIYGYTLAEFRALPPGGLRSPAARAGMTDQLDLFHAPGGIVFETVHQRKDGTTFPAEVSGRSVQLDGRPHLLGIFRDITERKAHEREIKRLNRMYRVISQVNQTIVRARSATELFPEVCRVLAEFGQFPIAWIGWPSADTRMLDPIAVGGDPHGYVPGLQVSLDSAASESRGPAGLAFRTGKIQIQNAFMTALGTQPWHERAAQYGIESCIALPLRQEGVVRGVLTVYATEKNFFGPREIDLLEEAAADLSFALDVFAGNERRRVAEAALQFTQLAMDNMADAVYWASSDGRLTYVNHAACRMLGYDRSELLEMTVDDIDVGTTAADWPAQWQKLKQSGVVIFESTHRPAHGPLIPVEVCASFMAFSGKELVCGHVRNITGRKRLEDELRQSAELYRLITENTSDIIYLYDLAAQRFTFVSPAAERLTGHAHAEIMRQDLMGLLTPESAATARQVLAQQFAAVAAGNKERNYTVGVYDIRHQDGRILTCEVITNFLFADTGQPTHILGVVRDVTERSRAEAELKKLSRVVEQSPTSIVITDLTGAIEYVNPWFCTLTGYTFDEVRGQNSRLLKSGETPPATYTDMWQTLAAGRTWRGELINKKKNGELYTELAVIAPVFDSTGVVTHYVAIKDDITERARTEAALRESEARFRALFNSSLDGLLLTRVSGEILSANPAASAILRLTEAEIRRRGREGFITADDPRLARLLEERRLHGRARGELTMIRGDGSRFEAEISSAAFGMGKDTLNGLVIHDITERVAARQTLQRFNTELEQQVAARTQALAESEARRELVLQANAMGTFEIDLATGEGHWNEAEFTLLGLKPGAAPSTAATLFRYVHPEDLGPLMARWEQALHTGEYDTEFRIVRADGQERWLAARGRLASGDTRAGRFFGINYDITARKRLEEETAALLERERELSEMKTRFISMTSHEFRTPMTAIMGSVELLANHLDRLDPDKRAQIFERVNTSLHRMTAMLDDVLTLNRMDAKRTEVRLTAVNLRPFLHNLVQEIRAGDQDAHPFVLQVPETDTPFVTDPGLLHHIVSNLLGNAVRYSPAGATVTIGVERDTWRLHLSVEDRGIGIPAADRARIFEPFERGSNVAHIKGTGLGLNIVKRLTELLGGHVTLRSTEGSGTRFNVAFPLRPLPDPKS